MQLDFTRCYAAVSSRDRRFDGRFVTAVRTTGIYCRPSCPATTPKSTNVEFLATAAAAQLRGYRACLRCRPDATPGSPDWNARADLAARAMRLITDGVVERDGVPGLAARLGYSERHLVRVLTAELGAGPVALARAHRAQSARILIETSELGMADIAFAAGFASVRQFNDTIRAVYGVTPTRLRTRAGRAEPTAGGLTLRLPLRPPHDTAGLFAFLAARAVPGVEVAEVGRYARTLRLPHGTATVELTPGAAEDHLTARLRLTDLRDLTSALARLRRLADLDADPLAVAERVGADPALGPLVAATPGMRLPGSVDPAELVLRALLGQQITVAAARTAAARLAEALGEPVAGPDGLDRLFPTAAAIADRGAEFLRGPARRTATIVTVSAAMAGGALDVDTGRDPEQLRADLLAQPGIGPWTASYVLMRVLGATDELLTTDVALRKGARHAGIPDDPVGLTAHAEAWRPWRSYAGMYLWRAAAPAPPFTERGSTRPSRQPDRPPKVKARSAFEQPVDGVAGAKLSARAEHCDAWGSSPR